MIFCLLGAISYAQEDDIATKNPEYYGILKTANNSFDREDYDDAIIGYQKILNISPNQSQIQLRYGVSLLKSGKVKTDAIPYLKAASKDGLYLATFYLGKAYHLANKFDSARSQYEIFKIHEGHFNIKKYEIDRAMEQSFLAEQLIANPTNISVNNAGNALNSPFSDYGAVVSTDHSSLLLTSRRADTRGGSMDNYGKYYEDIYITQNKDGDEWQEVVNIGTPINSKEHDATVALSVDGRLLIIYRTDPYTGEGDLYFSESKDNDWTVPVKLGMNINSPAAENSACLSPDGQTLYFSSNREGGFGGIDIYKSIKNKNGEWGKAITLGKNINTNDDDDAPFMYADGKTLFFSSKGHPQNMGGFDVFKSKIDEYGIWSYAHNLGYPINSTDDELYFVMPANAQIAYFTSSRIGTMGEQDIWKAHFKNDTVEVAVFKGVALEDAANKPIKAQILINEKNSGKLVSLHETDNQTGAFLVTLPKNITYVITFMYANLKYVETVEQLPKPKFRIIEKEIRLTTY